MKVFKPLVLVFSSAISVSLFVRVLGENHGGVKIIFFLAFLISTNFFNGYLLKKGIVFSILIGIFSGILGGVINIVDVQSIKSTFQEYGSATAISGYIEHILLMTFFSTPFSFAGGLFYRLQQIWGKHSEE